MASAADGPDVTGGGAMGDAAGDLEARFGAAMTGLAKSAGLADGADRLGIAVSGGPDSMALLDLAHRALAGRIAAATVDHGLRPASADEAAMVARWCAERGIDHVTLHPDRPVEGNVQAWARAVRYALLDQWRADMGLALVLTAHHADDQLETVLMRLNRGAGLSGLAAIRGLTGSVARPLLGVRKDALVAYARTRGLPFAQDPSNSDARFDRAALRARLAQAPWLDAQGAARSAAALAEADAALRWLVDDLAARHIRVEPPGVRLDRADFPREVRRRLLLRMIALADPDAPAPRGEAVDRLLDSAESGGKASIGALIVQGGRAWTVSLAPPRKAG